MDQNRDGIIDEGDLAAIFQQTGKIRLTDVCMVRACSNEYKI